MPIFLSKRQADLVEFMDREDCDLVKLQNTYKHFRVINSVLSNWRRIYIRKIRPLMTEKSHTYTMLDIGFGGGDIPLSISKWAKQDGFDLKITAIETDMRALQFVQTRASDPQVTFQHKSSTEVMNSGSKFDFVISNHLLHHLDRNTLIRILSEAKSLAKQVVVFNDIERSDIGFILYSIFTRAIFFNSFITADGLISIKRSFTKNELQQIASDGWKVERSFPFRLLLSFENAVKNSL